MSRFRVTKRKIIFFILAVIMMIVIFSFSAQPADESVELSYRVGKLVCGIFVPGYKEMSADKQYDLAKAIDYPVRKTAHATEYCILALLVAGAIVDYKSRTMENRELAAKYLKSQLSKAFVITVVYAASDEIHQLFVPGRAGRISDVGIDSIGACFGLIVLYFVIRKLVYSNRR